MEVIPLHLVAYSEELRTPRQAQLVAQASLAIRQLVNQVFKHKVFSRRPRVNLLSHNRLLRFSSLLRWANQLYRSRILSSELLSLSRTQLSNSGCSANKLINLQRLPVDSSEASNSSRNHPKREVVCLAELSLKAQWVEDFLAASNQPEWLPNLNSKHPSSVSPNSSNKTHPAYRSSKGKTHNSKINNNCLKLNKFRAIIS